MHTIPVAGSPNCRHTTYASLQSQLLSQIAFQTPPTQYSTVPASGTILSFNLTLPFEPTNYISGWSYIRWTKNEISYTCSVFQNMTFSYIFYTRLRRVEQGLMRINKMCRKSCPILWISCMHSCPKFKFLSSDTDNGSIIEVSLYCILTSSTRDGHQSISA